MAIGNSELVLERVKLVIAWEVLKSALGGLVEWVLWRLIGRQWCRSSS